MALPTEPSVPTTDESRRPVTAERAERIPAVAPTWDREDVVLVQDWIGSLGGAEQVIKELAALFPRAPILTLFATPSTVAQLGIDPGRVRQSYLGRIPSADRFRKYLVPWFADAIQTLDVGDASLVISASHAVAKGVPHRSYQHHLSYVYTPVRYAHDLMPQYVAQVPAPLRPWMRGVLRELAVWDIATAARVERFVAISRAVAERIRRTYRRRASVIHPPVDIERVPNVAVARGDHYVALSRLVRAKRIDLAIRAAAAADRRLVVIGDGPERAALERLAAELGAARRIEFVGRVSEQEKFALLAGARGLLFPGEEDFGIVGVEALAAGTPVVAFGRAGMLDILHTHYDPHLGGPARLAPGGVAFGTQTAESMVEAMRLLETGHASDRPILRGLAEEFSAGRFRARFLDIARRVTGER